MPQPLRNLRAIISGTNEDGTIQQIAELRQVNQEERQRFIHEVTMLRGSKQYMSTM